MKKGLDVLLDREAADEEGDRTWQVEDGGRAQPEQLRVDAARPAHDPFEASGPQLALQ